MSIQPLSANSCCGGTMRRSSPSICRRDAVRGPVAGTVEAAGVVFDLDGTLLDTEPFYSAAFHAAARTFGVVMPPTLYPALVGIATSERRPLLRRAFGNGFPVDDFITAYYMQRAAH